MPWEVITAPSSQSFEMFLSYREKGISLSVAARRAITPHKVSRFIPVIDRETCRVGFIPIGTKAPHSLSGSDNSLERIRRELNACGARYGRYPVYPVSGERGPGGTIAFAITFELEEKREPATPDADAAKALKRRKAAEPAAEAEEIRLDAKPAEPVLPPAAKATKPKPKAEPKAKPKAEAPPAQRAKPEPPRRGKPLDILTPKPSGETMVTMSDENPGKPPTYRMIRFQQAVDTVRRLAANEEPEMIEAQLGLPTPAILGLEKLLEKSLSYVRNGGRIDLNYAVRQFEQGGQVRVECIYDQEAA